MPDPLDLTLERRLRAGRGNLWRCWTEPELLMAWFCPLPWKVVDCVIDLRPGGAFGTDMRGPESERHATTGAWLQIEPRERLVFTSLLQADWRPAPRAEGALDMTAIIRFADAPGGGTDYSARVLHGSAEDRDAHAAMGFHEGWGAATAQLDALALTL